MKTTQLAMISLLLGIGVCAGTTAAAKPKKPKPIPVMDPEWDDTGIDTTQPQWYRKHPFWTHVHSAFQKQSDSIVARLKDSIPATPDSVMRYYKGGRVEYHPEGVVGKGLMFEGKGLILRPQILRSSSYHGTPVAVIRPEDGPWRVLSVYRPIGEPYPPELKASERSVFSRSSGNYELDGLAVDRMTKPAEALKISSLGYNALVAGPGKKPLGWIPVDSIALFPDSTDANVSAPFYQDGIAAFVHGAWKSEDHKGDRMDEDLLSNLGTLHINDMIHLWSIQMRPADYQIANTPAKLKPCIKHGDPEIPNWVYLLASCVDKQDSIPVGFFYESAGWQRFRRIEKVHAGCDAEMGSTSKGCGMYLGPIQGIAHYSWIYGTLDARTPGVDKFHLKKALVP
jgi:hypothetical protein